MLLYPGKNVRNIFHLKKKTLNKWTDAWRRETALFANDETEIAQKIKKIDMSYKIKWTRALDKFYVNMFRKPT